MMFAFQAIYTVTSLAWKDLELKFFPNLFIHDLGKILAKCTFLNTHVSKLKVPLYWSLISHLSVYDIYGYILVCLYDDLGNC